MDGMEIQDLEVSPTATRRLPSITSPDPEPETSVSGETTENEAGRLSTSPKDAWPRLNSPRKKSEKNVFKFLKENDPNYTVRRQQMQMSIMLEKNQHVKQVRDTLEEEVMTKITISSFCSRMNVCCSLLTVTSSRG